MPVLSFQHVLSRFFGFVPPFLKVLQGVVMALLVTDVALRDIPTCFITWQRLFCVTGAVL